LNQRPNFYPDNSFIKSIFFQKNADTINVIRYQQNFLKLNFCLLNLKQIGQTIFLFYPKLFKAEDNFSCTSFPISSIFGLFTISKAAKGFIIATSVLPSPNSLKVTLQGSKVLTVGSTESILSAYTGLQAPKIT